MLGACIYEEEMITKKAYIAHTYLSDDSFCFYRRFEACFK
jgi:hypothetical protein